MKFIEFSFKNYKGIEDITFQLNTSPSGNIFTLVGLNESGKTTILEAINQFSPIESGLNALDLPGAKVKDYNELIPISKRDNFNDTIEIIVKILLETEDLQKIQKFTLENTLMKKVLAHNNILVYRSKYLYKNSEFQRLESRWSGFSGSLKTASRESFKPIGPNFHSEVNAKLSTFCRTLIPDILYFPNFLFDFPSKIYLESQLNATAKEKFYIELIQDILNSLNNDTNITTHIIDRVKRNDPSQKRNLARLLQLTERKVTDVIFDAWNRIFKRKITDTRVIINYDIDENNLVYLEFEIEAEDGIYQINERSLGFKWFFIFLLFTQFRPFRKGSPQNVLFLFDEPASNLHSSAQKQLLKSFENLTENSKIIYTTHSHHLINPNWLENTYVVKNNGLNLENPENYNIKKTSISIEPYRKFAVNHPHNTAYFQPILDVLEYTPSDLENIPNCVFIEGKNDFYNLAYFKEIIFENDFSMNMAPSTGSSNLDTLISLYIGWGKKFILLLDSDNEGIQQRKRYTEKFGVIMNNKIFTLLDISPDWKNYALEKLYLPDDQILIQNSAYKESGGFNKTHFNRAVQENLINRKRLDLSQQTKDNFKLVLTFLQNKTS